jgi:hypothetical protein
MKMPKRIAAIALCIAVFFLGTQVSAQYCTTLAAWFPAVHYDAWEFWLTPLFFVLFIYHPAYDLLSFASYKLGYEATFDEALIYPEDGTIPVTLRQKLFGYPFMFAIMALFVVAWAKMAYCG